MGSETTAELIYPAGEKSADSDYHKNMDSDTFMDWIANRLVPAFEAKYPFTEDGKKMKMILVMDNAAYHHGMPEGWTNPLQASKQTNLQTLRGLKEHLLDTIVLSNGTQGRGINVSRGGRTMGFPLPANSRGESTGDVDDEGGEVFQGQRPR